MKTVIVIAIMFLLVGCNTTQPEKTKYTIWLGNTIISSGQDAVSYRDSLDYLIFTRPNGITRTVPKCNVMAIDKNK